MLKQIKLKLMGFYQLMKFDNSLELIINRLFFRKYGLNIYRMKGMEIIIDHAGGDENGTRAALTDDMYRKYLSQISTEKPVNILDLGANGGGVLLLVAMMGFSFKKLVAVEMNPYTYSRLQFNIMHNISARNKPILLNVAVCGKEKTFSITLGKGSTGDSLYHGSNNGVPMEIKGEALDNICERYFPHEIINICKIDIEGAEYEVFDKLPKSLNHIEYIVMEIHGSQDQRMVLLKKLQENNFSLLSSPVPTDNVFFFKNKNISITPLQNAG